MTSSRKETLSSRLAIRLREQILGGALPPGSKINLDRLREEHDSSISPLREAVSRLVSDGLVSFEDQRGYSVTPISAANLAEVTRLRAELEGLALETALREGDLDWESDVMRALYQLTHTRRDPAVPATLEAWEAAHSAFHRALVSGCNMPLLLHFCTMLHHLNDRYRRLFQPPGGDGRNLDDEHRAIAEAATRRSPEAVVLLRCHVLGTGAALQARMADSEARPAG